MKRLIDCLVSSIGLLVLMPLFGVIALLIKVDSRGSVFFRQERVGRDFASFWIYKFRSMVVDAHEKGSAITVSRDPRVTRVGALLRRTKLDELPQLFNVLIGDMSLVGPRPEVARYVMRFRSDYEEILCVRPGITDLASLKYSDEEAVLAGAEDPEEAYVNLILPDKIALAKECVRRSSLFFDTTVIARTILRIVNPRCTAGGGVSKASGRCF